MFPHKRHSRAIYYSPVLHPFWFLTLPPSPHWSNLWSRLAIDVFGVPTDNWRHGSLPGPRRSTRIVICIWYSLVFMYFWSFQHTIFPKSELANCLITLWSFFLSWLPNPHLLFVFLTQKIPNNSITFQCSPHCNGWEMLSHFKMPCVQSSCIYINADFVLCASDYW